MRAVIDTNVLVSAAINRRGNPARVIEAVVHLDLTPCVSADILAEYAEVLKRPHFGFPEALVAELLAHFDGLGILIEPVAPELAACPDPGDAPFVAVALGAACPVVTGNPRHFPKSLGIEVLTPTECLARLRGR